MGALRAPGVAMPTMVCCLNMEAEA